MQIKKECGVVELRMANIPEMMILLGEIGVDSNKEDLSSMNENLIYIGRLMMKLGPLVVKIDLKTNCGKKVNSYDEALKHFEFMEILSEAASEVFKGMEIANKKKS